MRRGAQLAFRDLLDTVTLIDSADQPVMGLWGAAKRLVGLPRHNLEEVERGHTA
jgi:hypothetical protein